MSTAHEAPALEFYTNDMCPYAQRVWIVLEELGVPYNKTLIDLRDKPAWYVQSVNPRGKVPAIRDLSDGTVVVESLVANEYLVERFGEQHESSLMPSQAEPRARVRLWNAHLDSVLAPAQFTLLMNRDAETEEQKLAALHAALDVYERELVGPYLVGEMFTLADAAALPFFERLTVSLRHFKGLEPIDAQRYPRLTRYLETAMARPSFLATKRDEADLIRVYQAFVSTDYKFGGLNRA